jgi:hypothetical protein
MTTALTLIEILAIVMFGEAGMLHDEMAAKAVGHVFMNRLALQPNDAPSSVMKGFHSYDVVELSDVPPEYYDWADKLIHEYDPTRGSLFIFSWQDLNNLHGMYGPYIRQQTDWKSKQIIGSDNLPYGLFAYKKWPMVDCSSDSARAYTDMIIKLFDESYHSKQRFLNRQEWCREYQGEWK